MPFTPFFLLPFLLLYNSPPAVIFRHLLALSLIAHLRRTLYSLSLSSFMTPVYQKSPFVDQKEEDQQRFKLFSFSANQASSSLSCAASFSTVGKSLLFGESNDQEVISSPSSSSSPVVCEERVAVITGNGEKDHSSARDLQGSVKWMSSKKRIMQEMVNKDAEAVAAGHDSGNRQYEKSVMASASSISNSHNISIRVCSDCKTTTTPLWRSGPEGPKTLCNACGIRQRKARTAMAEAAGAAASSTVVSCSSTSLKQKKEKKSRRTSHVGQNKSKIKLTGTGNGERKLSFNNLGLGLSKTSAFGRVFPRDEEEATILLMELSRGIVHG